MQAKKKPQSSISGTQTIQRAALLLRLLTSNNRTGLRLVDLYQKAGLERSTTHRILQGLIAEQLVSQHPSNKRYFLGSGIYEMGLAAAPPFNLRDLCHPHIKALAQASGDTVFLVVRSGFDGVCVDRQEGSFPIRVFVMEIGRRRPLNIGGGNIAIMSTLPDDEIERISMVNKERIAESYPNYSEKIFHERIAQARDKGFLINSVLEVPRAKSIAVPVRTSFEGSSTVAISISAVNERMQPSRIEELSTLLLETAKKIEKETSALLG